MDPSSELELIRRRSTTLINMMEGGFYSHCKACSFGFRPEAYCICHHVLASLL